MGKIFVFCRIKLKFRFWLYKKRCHTSCKLQLEITSNKIVIAKKPLTNLYEMNSRSKCTKYSNALDIGNSKENKRIHLKINATCSYPIKINQIIQQNTFDRIQEGKYLPNNLLVIFICRLLSRNTSISIN